MLSARGFWFGGFALPMLCDLPRPGALRLGAQVFGYRNVPTSTDQKTGSPEVPL